MRPLLIFVHAFTTASVDLVLSVASHFGLKHREAKQMARSLANCRIHAKRLGLSAREIKRMASAFEHQDQAKAARL